MQALQLSHMKHLNDDSLAALVVAARQLVTLGLQEPGRSVQAQQVAMGCIILPMHADDA